MPKVYPLPKVLFTSLADTDLVGSDLNGEVLIVSDLKRKIENGDMKARLASWGVVKVNFWKPDAQEVLTNLVEGNADEMYEGWDEMVEKFITPEAVQKLQSVLDEIFSDEEARISWDKVGTVVMDLKLPKKK